MRALRFVLAIALLPAFAWVASAQDEQRYRLEKTDKGYVRMDTRTGQMSICEERSAELVCRVAAEERTALQDEIDRLGNSLKALEERIARLEKAPTVGLPTEEQFDKTMTYMQRFFRGFMDMVEEYKDKDDPEAVPQRT
jgi:hypothetical protein